MKSSTLIMAIILVAQAFLIMGVFAAVSIENSAAVGEKVTMAEPKLLNPGNLTCCTMCKDVSSPPSGLFKCKDVGTGDSWCTSSGCRNCVPYGKTYRNTFICNDEFNGHTCGPPCPKN